MKKLGYYQTREEKVANSAFSALGCKWVQDNQFIKYLLKDYHVQGGYGVRHE